MIDITKLINTIISQIPGIIIGGISTATFLIGKGYVEIYFEKIKRINKHKLYVAKHVLDLCNEASSSSYSKRPRDYEHALSVITNVSGIDNRIEVNMRKLISLWVLIAHREHPNMSPDDLSLNIEMRKEVDINREILINWANKIRLDT